MKKRLAILIILAAVLAAGTAMALESGPWGTNATWAFDGSTLTFTGSGELMGGTFDEIDFTKISTVKKVVIGEGITATGDYSFYNFYGLKEVKLPSSLKRIKVGAFKNCMPLETVNLPANLEYIGDEAFSGDLYLKNVTIPGKVASVGNHAFNGCSAFTEIVISEGVESLGEGAFCGCDSLKAATVPESVKTIGKDVFKYTHASFVVKCYEGSAMDKYAKANGLNVEYLPKKHKVTGVGCTIIFASGDNQGEEAKEAIMGDRLQVHVDNCPAGKYLAGVTCNVPGVTFSAVFKFDMPDCDITVTADLRDQKAKTLDLRDSRAPTDDDAQDSIVHAADAGTITAIPDGSSWKFDLDKDGHGDVLLANVGGEWKLSALATSSVKHVITVTCPEAEYSPLTVLFRDYTVHFDAAGGSGSMADAAVRPGDKLTLPACGFKAPDKKMFNKWDKGKPGAKIVVKGDMTVKALWKAAKFTYSDETGKYLVTNGEAAYTNAPKDASDVTIPATISTGGKTYPVTAIGDKAFYNRKMLTQVKIGKNVQTVGKRAFDGCTQLERVLGGVNVVILKDSAFLGCKSLFSFPKMNKLTTIGAMAFKNCSSLETFTLGAKVSLVGAKAFLNCEALGAITVKTTKLTLNNVKANAFKNIYRKVSFKCPKKKVKEYQSLFRKRGAPATGKFK